MIVSKHLQRKSRPWIAIVAAYAIALQMLLSLAIASQAAAAGPEGLSICYGLSADADGHGTTDGKVHHAPCVLCTVGLSAPVDQPVVNSAPVYLGSGVVLVHAPRGIVHAQAPPSPRLSQGPPQIL